MNEPVSTASPAAGPGRPDDLDSLTATARRAADWAATADQLKNSVSRARGIVFALSIAGAAAATIAGQISANGSLRTIFAAFGVVALAVAAFITSRFLRADETTQ